MCSSNVSSSCSDPVWLTGLYNLITILLPPPSSLSVCLHLSPVLCLSLFHFPLLPFPLSPLLSSLFCVCFSSLCSPLPPLFTSPCLSPCHPLSCGVFMWLFCLAGRVDQSAPSSSAQLAGERRGLLGELPDPLPAWPWPRLERGHVQDQRWAEGKHPPAHWYDIHADVQICRTHTGDRYTLPISTKHVTQLVWVGP